MTGTVPDTSTGTAYLQEITALLEAYFSKFPKDRERVPVLLKQLADGDVDLTNRKNTPGHLTASALVYTKEEKTVLLIKHKFLDRWLQPGGHLDFEEAPLAGATRELSEETGLTLPLHSWHEENLIPIDVDSHQIPVNPNKGEGEHQHHDFQYIYVMKKEAGTSVTLQAEEVDKYKWASLAEVATGAYGQRLKRVAEKIAALAL